MTGRPAVSVIVATYNNADCLNRALDSVVAQTRPDWECLVIDDASTDATPRVMRRRTADDPRFQSYRLARNRGSGAARNVGWRHAGAEWIAVLDADDWWPPDKLAVQLAALAGRPEAQWSCTGVRYLRDGMTLKEAGPPVEVAERLLGADDAVVHSSVIYRRDALLALNGFDESLRRSQDWDLFLRLLAAYGPAAMVGVPDILLNYTVRRGLLPRHIVEHGRRCQARVVGRYLLRDGWALRRPRLAWHLVDGYVDRLVEWTSAVGPRRDAVLFAALACVLAPARRWRWRRLAALVHGGA